MKILLSVCLSLATITSYADEKTVCPMVQNASSNSQNQASCPMSANISEQHAAGVDQRGDHAMGFSHEKTKHHFKLTSDGGIIEVDANKKTDTATRDQISQHLTHIASMFSSNNFEMPMYIHDTVPPGVPVMKEKHGAISYTVMPTKKGAMVRIVTHDPEALQAVHEFLAFQIKDHRTGDSMSVQKLPSNRP